MMFEDTCEHGASGFCMLCCREDEGKGNPIKTKFCLYGRDPIVSKSRIVCYGRPSHDGFCDEHKHLAGTKEEVYEQARKSK